MPRFEARAARAVWWSTLEIVARYGTQFVVTVVLARLLSPTDFGQIAIVLAFTSVGAVLVDSGFGTALVQRPTISEDDKATVLIFGLFAGIATYAVLAWAAGSIAGFFEQPDLIWPIRVVAVVVPLGAIAAVPDALLTRAMDFRSRAKAEIIASLVSGFAAIVLAVCHFGIFSLVWQAVAAATLRALLLFVFSGYLLRGRFRTSAFKGMFSFGGYLLLSRLLDTAFLRMQSLLIGKLFEPRELGFYALAQSTQQAPTSFLDGILSRVGLPIFSALNQDREKMISALRTSLRIALFAFLPCMVGVAIVSRPLVDLLYGTRWEPAAPILSILAIGAAFWPLHVLNLAAINAVGRSDLFFRLEFVKKTLAIGAILIASTEGTMAIAWAILVISIIGVVVNTHYSKTLIGYGLADQLLDQLPTVILAAVAALPGWAILHWSNANPSTMALSLIISGAIYIGIAAITRNLAFTGLIALIRAMRAPV